ncbi:GNAT family N-acetyltransferase, partial [Streptomyces erythrochromogenes]|uniref:GNAT family N-acetyltransferase n=1 Tax=Streptomyces erythrochromogenes TaxID=285574 RepID=UPI00380C4E06
APGTRPGPPPRSRPGPWTLQPGPSTGHTPALGSLPEIGTIAEAVVRYAFDGLGLTEVHATVGEPNPASLVLLERIGFAHVRDLQEDDGSTTHVLTRHREPAAS